MRNAVPCQQQASESYSSAHHCCGKVGAYVGRFATRLPGWLQRCKGKALGLGWVTSRVVMCCGACVRQRNKVSSQRSLSVSYAIGWGLVKCQMNR